MSNTTDTRFKPGQSGNPRGRPAGIDAVRALLEGRREDMVGACPKPDSHERLLMAASVSPRPSLTADLGGHPASTVIFLSTSELAVSAIKSRWPGAAFCTPALQQHPLPKLAAIELSANVRQRYSQDVSGSKCRANSMASCSTRPTTSIAGSMR